MEDDFEVLEHCDIDCQNGGLCRQGDASFPILGPTKEPLQIFATRNLNGFHCQCRPGYTGVDCSIKYETCFDQQSGIVAQCFHGGRCRSLDQVDYEHYNLCDCEPAGEDSGDRYTGKYCEIKATFDSFCEGNDGFCLNGGVCSGSGDGAAGCNCTDAFWGDHCEEVFDDRPTECTLECRNGGECRIEARDMIDELTDHLYDVLNLDQMYCECPPGFGGLLCQYEVDVCGDYKKICLHGSRCVSDVEDQSGFRCECSNPSCALEMELCNPSDGVVEYSAGMAVPAYCFNGGKCKDLVVNGLVHPGCDCPELFHGPRCELLKNGHDLYVPKATTQSSDDDLRKYGLMSLYIFLGISITTIILFFIRRRWMQLRRRPKPDVMNMNLHSYRDDDFGVKSKNGGMLFPAPVKARTSNGNELFPDSSTGSQRPRPLPCSATPPKVDSDLMEALGLT